MKRIGIAFMGLMLSGWALASTAASQTPQVEAVATYRGPGGISASVVGPGPTPGSERLYLTYMYAGRTVDLVSVDPTSGKWRAFENPAKTEYGAIMAVGPDGNIYLGTRPHAHIYRFNPRTGEYKDLGQPAPGEAYIWQLTVASDGKIYGCTYPSSKMVRLDPASGRLADLGRMDPTQLYGRHIAASKDGFVYEGIGTARAHLVAYQIATGEHRDILPPSLGVGSDNRGGIGNTALVYKGDDGRIYAVAGKEYFLVKDWTVKEIPESEVRPEASETRLKDGSLVKVDGDKLLVTGAGTADIERLPYTYPGREENVFRIAAGSNHRIYGSSVLPLHFFSLNTDTNQLEDFGYLGGGEAYSLLSFEGKFYIAAYGGEDETPLMAFDPTRHFAPGAMTGSNPLLITYDGADSGWRPQAMVVGPDKKFYIGSVAGYGSVNGPLTIFDPRTNQVVKLSGVVPDQSIITLAATGDLVVGGTSIFGGGGSHPTQGEAKLFLWDTLHSRKIHEGVPVPGASGITDMLALPGGKVMGIATGGKPDTTSPSLARAGGNAVLFVFDLHSRKVDYTVPVSLGEMIYNSVALGPDGAVWGLARDGIFRFDPKTHNLQLKLKTPVTAGFALMDNSIYYASGPVIYRYALTTGR